MVQRHFFILLWALVLCALAFGCSSDEGASRTSAALTLAGAPVAPQSSAAVSAPSAAGAPSAAPGPRESAVSGSTARIPIEQTMGRVVLHDSERIARAYENGLVGRPAPVPSEAPKAKATALATRDGGCNLPPGEPCPDDPEPPSLSVQPASVDAVLLNYTCGGAVGIVRTSPTPKDLSADCFRNSTADTGLQPGTTYCYALKNEDGTFAAGPYCATTLWAPYLFTGPAISQAESEAMAASFDWTHTNPVATTISVGSGTQTALYSMNILVKSADDMFSLQSAGIHTQTQPLLPDEQAAWDGTIAKAMAAGEPAGVWITAVVPGPIYNDLRSQAITAINNHQAFGIKAMAFRQIHAPGAALYPNTSVAPVSPLNPTYLGQMGFEFNGFSAISCDNGSPRLCTIQQGLFGHLLSLGISLVVDLVEAAVDGVREIIGAITRLVVGEVDVTIQLVVRNSDELFGLGEPTRSGWNAGAPLVLRHLPVRVYQGAAEFTATTDENGVATVHVAKNFDGKVCVDLQNDKVTLIDWFTARRACIGSFSGTSSATTVTIPTTDKYVNVLATMTDAGDYLHTVMNLNMPPVSVLTGWQSSLLSSWKNRSFTPCLGRMPNLTENLAIYSAALVSPLITLLGEAAEFFNSYDIILDESDARSHGVPVHEYGHAAMCQLLRNADQVKASEAWAEVSVASLSGQDASSQPAVLAESFADFVALQVVGGANYFFPSSYRESRKMKYCQADAALASDCVESNSTWCTGSGCDIKTNIAWSASLLQDVFDRVPADAAARANPPAELPNDASHWVYNGSIMVPDHASNQVASGPVEADVIQLPGPRLGNIFGAWSERGSLLRYDSFYGGLARVLKTEGYTRSQVCAMFAAHEPSGTCPRYVSDAFGDRIAYAWADQPSSTDYTPHSSYAFNGTGSSITIHRSDIGRYRVSFDGLPAWSTNMSASVSLTAYGSSTITCSVAAINSTTDSSSVDVSCWDNVAHAAADSRFSILLLGDSVMPSPSAFLASGGPAPVAAPNPLLSWTSGTHALSVTHNTGIGDYNVNLGVGNAPLSAKLVTPGGTAGARCNEAQGISAGLQIKCYGPSGAPADGTFYTSQIAGGRPGKRFGFAFASQRESTSYAPSASTAYNSSGGPITISRPSVGHYLVNFAGLQKDSGRTENVQVTGIGTTLAMCNVVNWVNGPDGLLVAIECRDANSAFVDARYEVMVIE